MAGPNAASNHQLVIVALPSEHDEVRQASSEKEPHLTLLYLGDVPEEQVSHVVDYVEHATSQLSSFQLDVTERGTLGDKNADVLFFSTKWAKGIQDFRGFLLKDPVISTAYQSVEQFDSWTPHLTLGFPETPAKMDASKYPRPYTGVFFDRVAVWTGDYEGPTFKLKNEFDSEVVAMSQLKLSPAPGDILAHYGIKGMKWGVRKNDSGSGPKPGASPDSAAASNSEAKIKAAGGAHVLSNQELQHLVNRMNLEKQYSDIKSKHKSELDKGLETTKKLLKVAKTVDEVRRFMDTPGGKAIKTGLKGALLLA